MKENIEKAILAFEHTPLTKACIRLFDALGYNTQTQEDLPEKTVAGFLSAYDLVGFDHQKARTAEWLYIDKVFELTEYELQAQKLFIGAGRQGNQDIAQYNFFCIQLAGKEYKREQLANITREINKHFLVPAMLVFRYAGVVSVAVINRRLNKKDEAKDVLEKVTLIKDIDIQSPKRSQIDILQDLALPALHEKYTIKSFVDMHNAWQKVLDTKELNKRFFKEIANWYFWAVDTARFPALSNQTQEQANQIAIIRLLTRLIFVWFIKEKGLVKDTLFNPDKVQDYFTDFEAWKAFFETTYQIKLTEKDKTNYFHSQYYKAVLQNVFFASLNADVKREEKHFIQHCTKQRKDSSHSAGAVYRYRYFFKDEKKALQDLFIDIPFLNGGLFDALEQGNTKIDAFTNPIENQGLMHLPDVLFFGEESASFSDALKKIYDVKDKKTTYKVKGIINILKQYKFTIQENTPLEEDVALDPELLGQVFENLLAYYNPETGATARKGTGSFYTPREIVDYMVEESLKAYLKIDSLEALQQASPTEKEACIRQLAHIKILDPACGSGAFPMGVLHKIVDILKTMDKDNAIWRKIQKERAQAEIDLAYDIKEREERQKRLNEIDEIFENNLEDYGRKLFIIQNCIYGVDIQNIAIQISKLRFFLSLVIEQSLTQTLSKGEDLDSPLSRRGAGGEAIKPLPNLETKFVCANTLIALDKPKGQAKLQNPHIETKEAEIQRLRARYFRIRSRQEKKNLITQDETLRQELASLLQADGWGKASAQKIANFNLFDQNASADWFDADMMFGVKEGFDVVLGNPPYGVSIKGDYRKAVTDSLGKVPDFEIYYYFVELSYKILHDKGFVSLIIPNTFLFNTFAKDYRKQILERWHINFILDCSSFKIFENASVFNAIIGFNKHNILKFAGFKNTLNVSSFKELVSKETSQVNYDKLLENNQNWALLFRLDNSIIDLVGNIKDGKNTLITLFPDVSQGLIAYDKYKGQDKQIIESRAYHYSYKAKDDLKKWLWGEDVTRYKIAWNSKEYIDYCSNIANPRQPKFFIGERILIREITNPSIYAGYTGEELYHDPSIIVILANNNGLSCKVLLAILNSKLITFYHFNSSPKASKGGFPKILVEDIKNFPIPKIINQQPFEMLVEYILWLRAGEEVRVNEYVSNAHIAGQFEEVLDAMVFELYFGESVKAKDADVLQYIVPSQGFVPILPTMTDEEKRVTIGAVYDAYRQKEHEVRNNVILQKFNVPEIITIFKSFRKS